jgi:hypothetical protein
MKGHPIKYSAEELAWLSENRTLSISDCHGQFSARFNRRDVTASNLHSLRKRKGWKTGRTGCFEKGHIPHPNSYPKGPNKASFKKGNKPHNWRPLGSRRVSKDGYIEIKTAEPSTWQQLHIINWVTQYGPIPEGHCVVFKDGNKLNVEPSNLELITRNANLQINRLRCTSQPQELRPTVRIMGKLIAKTIDVSKPETSNPRKAQEQIA